MFEKIKNKASEIFTKIDKRFNLSGQYGPVAFGTDVELSVRVVENKITEFGNNVSKEWIKMADNPREYFTNKFSAIKAKATNSIEKASEKIKTVFSKDSTFKQDLTNWFKDKAVEIVSGEMQSAVAEKINTTRAKFEIQKLMVAVDDEKYKKETRKEIGKRILQLVEERDKYKTLKGKQKEVGLKFRTAIYELSYAN